MNQEKYLPVGTVCELKDGYKKLMITGYLVESEGNVYDYMGCFYPEGTLFLDKQIMFNHDQIKTIYYMGYTSNESKNFNTKLENIRKNLNK
jgi:hypothetical protein